jgi:3-hydroxybutyryl-CoA dehydrogenase
MKIAILGKGIKLSYWENRLSENSSIAWVQDTKSTEIYDLFIDLEFDEHTERILDYSQNPHTQFLLSANFVTIENALKDHQIKNNGAHLFGFNSFPVFVDINTIEMTNPTTSDTAVISDILKSINFTKIHWVDSRVGLVTSRIICMIINEAYYTVMEGTATKTDINLAMKLGTNYPKGPFEFVESIGLDNVYNQLLSLYKDTMDERYKICPLLKQEYLKL